MMQVSNLLEQQKQLKMLEYDLFAGLYLLKKRNLG